MSVIDNLLTRQTGYRTPVRTGVSATIITDKTGASEPMGFGTNDEYEMTLTVRYTFWAGNTMKDEAFAVAKKALLHNLYADILPDISAAQSAVCGDDNETAMALLGKIKRTILGV